MFSHIKHFAAIAFILVLVAAFFVGKTFKEIATADMITLVSTNSNALAQGFTNTVWSSQRDNISQALNYHKQFTASKLPASEWSKYQGYAEMNAGFNAIGKAMFKYFEEVPISKVSLYSPDGLLVVTIEPSQMSTITSNTNPPMIDEAGKQYLIEVARGGTKKSEILYDVDIKQADGTVRKGNVVRTIAPLVDAKYVSVIISDPAAQNNEKPVQGILEIHLDVTEQSMNLNQFQIIGSAGIVVIFIIVIVLLLVISNKAEAIIAKQHETNIELASQAATAQAENRDKSQFLANVSHELRTPLNAIIGFSEMIKNERMGPMGNDKYVEYIRDIHGSGTHLLSLINDILDYSKAEADKLELDVSEVDITKAVKNSMRLVSPRAEQANVTLIEEIPKEHYILKTDQKKFKQVMLNLLSNAVKFTPAGGSVTVAAWQNVVDESVTIEVKDTGIGIAPKDISRAMAPFGQVDSALSRKYEGTGLGLPLTKKFVELMGGTFNITSEVNVGTTITFTLPKEAPQKK
jgi:two-component system cell cycle sensor histidine kinase PleC